MAPITVEGPAHIARIEVQFIRAARVAPVERTRPVGAVAACIVERTVAADACGGEEDRVTIALAGYLMTIYSIFCSPCPSTFGDQFG